jgi:hypothetical protein
MNEHSEDSTYNLPLHSEFSYQNLCLFLLLSSQGEKPVKSERKL